MAKRSDRILFRGREYDYLTMAGHLHWEYCLGKLDGRDGPVEIPISQGPFSTAVAQSGNTHAGSGAEDTGCPSGVTWGQLAWAGRLAGWFASVRLASQGDWGQHVHAVQYGNPWLSTAAAQQISNWMNYDDAGLVGNDRDVMRDPEPMVALRYPLGRVSLERVQDEFSKTRGWQPRSGVRHVQRALNLKTGTTLTVDGIAGPKTRRALGRWELANGGDGDGIPGAMLWLLGAARFEVE